MLLRIDEKVKRKKNKIVLTLNYRMDFKYICQAKLLKRNAHE